jgi:lipid-A-disaccharide synthase
LKVRQVNLINLILGRPVVPEYLRGDCVPEKLAEGLAELIRDERVRAAHREEYDEAVQRLQAGGLSPSRNAADRILAIVAERRRAECAAGKPKERKTP